MSDRAAIGSEGERAAAEFLEARGYRILERNYRTKLGELDLVAEEGDTLVFIEVKVRLNDRFGGPAAAITSAKQSRIARLAQQYVVSRRLSGRPCRFDVVLIWGRDPRTRRIELLPGAFEAPANRSTA